ncbi:MAG: VirB6/TrbL-like conjugal transfer protein, CD1112 family [Sedimentibacter sp.]
MQSIIDKITEWLKEILVSGIMGNLSGMFDNVNQKVGEIAGEVGMTPSAWNGGVFSMIRNLSETVIIPIAGMILTFVMCYELIQMVIEKNNMHDIDTFMFFKWIFKTFVAVMIITNTFNIVMAVFDLSQHVVSGAAGVIISDTSIDISSVIVDMEPRLMEMELGPLFGLWLQSMFVGLTMHILSICIFIVIYGRMIEIYMMTSVAPIPFATMSNRELGSMGQNYLRSLFALGFQAFLIMVCVGIYAVLVQSITTDEDIIGAIWTCVGYTVLLCFTLFKTGSLAKSIFNSN